MTKNKVALVHDHLFQHGGAENVLLEMNDLFPKAPIYTLVYDKEKAEQFADKKIITSFIDKWWGAKKHFKWFLPIMPLAWEQIDFSSYDIVLSSCSAFCKGLLTPPNTMHVSYCHSPTRYLWSDAQSYVAELNQPKIVKLFLPILLNRLRQWDFQAAQRVDYFIANSEFVAKRIKKYYRRDSKVIYPPVNVNKYTVSDKVGNYYVVVSRLRPYKRVDLAVDAFNQLGLPLVVVGGGEEYDKLKNRAKDNIKFVGEVSDEEKNRILGGSKAFIFPQEEDFGISPVEAMACGKPVIAYRSGGALETVVENKTGVFFDEQHWESLVEAVLKFENEKHQYSATEIRQWAERFSSEVFKKELNDYVNSCWQDFSAKHVQSN